MSISLKCLVRHPILQAEALGNVFGPTTGWAMGNLSLSPSFSAPIVAIAESLPLWGLLIWHEIRNGRRLL
jgi:hypothetical protein